MGLISRVSSRTYRFFKKMSLLNLTFRNKALIAPRIKLGQSKILSPITIQQRFGHVYYGKTMHVMPKTKNPMASPNAWLWSQGLDTYAVKPYKELGWGVARDCLIQGIIMGFVICILLFLKFFMYI